MSPDLSAVVPPSTRVRITYSLVWQSIFGGAEPGALVDAINESWEASGQAVVLSEATAPIAGPDLELGLQHSGAVTIDLQTDYSLPTMTWDQWLAPLRSITPSFLFLGDNAQLAQLDLLPQAGTPAASSATQAAARTAAATKASGTASAGSPLSQLSTLFASVSSRAMVLGVIVIVLVLLWQFGPALGALLKGAKKARA